jgi:hypothetical protein
VQYDYINLDKNALLSTNQESFSHLEFVLTVSSAEDHLLVLMTHICLGNMMRSY